MFEPRDGTCAAVPGHLDTEAAANVESRSLPSLETLYPSRRSLAIIGSIKTFRYRLRSTGHGPRLFGLRNLGRRHRIQGPSSTGSDHRRGTELGVLRNKQGVEHPALMSLAAVPGLADINSNDDTVVIGANVTWTQIEAFARDAWPEFHRIVVRFGSPQIRNVATMVANVAHGSPIADSLPFLFVADAELELVGRAGQRRVKINDFYRGYKVKDLAPEEIITHVRIPHFASDDLLKLYKVSRRNDLDIATFGAAMRIRKVDDRIARAHLAYSGVAPTVVRLPRTEAYLQGKRFSEETFAAAGQMARSEIQPISDVRGSRDFRWRLAEKILLKFYFDCTEAELASRAP